MVNKNATIKFDVTRQNDDVILIDDIDGWMRKMHYLIFICLSSLSRENIFRFKR